MGATDKVLEKVTERIFVFPTLILMSEVESISTSELIVKLMLMFQPDGHDKEIISGRGDSYFSQKVRNLKSHQKISSYVDYSRNKWLLNDAGVLFLHSNNDLIEEIKVILYNNTFSYSEKITFIDKAIQHLFPRRKIPTVRVPSKGVPKQRNINQEKVYSFDEIVTEGTLSTRTVMIKERSRKLRDYAVKNFTHDETIKCEICGFDYKVTYGALGEGYIEIHHKKPVYMYENDDMVQIMDEAIRNVCPVCASCHRMLHRTKSTTYEIVVKAYNDNKLDDNSNDNV